MNSPRVQAVTYRTTEVTTYSFDGLIMDLCRLHTELAQAYDRVERVWEACHGNKQKFANRLVEGEFHGVLEQANLSQIDWSGGGV